MRQLSIAVPKCVAEDFDGEVVALNLDTGLYFSLPGLAGAVWRDLTAGFPPDTMLEEMAQTNDTLAADGRAYIGALVHHGLLREADGENPVPEDPEFRKLVGGGDYDLTFTAHDDMKDLVMTDPIHDVDEDAGWPVQRENAS